MMKLELMNLNGEKVKDVNLEKSIFGIEPNDVVLKDAVVLGRAALRQGTHKAKTRAEVSGGGRKPWRQKGTGNARQGSIRAVQWVGGGIAFGPVPRSYDKKQNRKERRLALKSAYSYKAKDNAIVVVEDIKFNTPKTKEMVALLKNLGLENDKTLLIVKEYDENVILASRNLKKVMIETVSEVSVLDLMSAKKVLIENSALEEIKEVLK
ncbi:MAG: 50S ribosomal protein L4 [bacterium]|nr:50S ribosomal protein L4 [bacterium]